MIKPGAGDPCSPSRRTLPKVHGTSSPPALAMVVTTARAGGELVPWTITQAMAASQPRAHAIGNTESRPLKLSTSPALLHQISTFRCFCNRAPPAAGSSPHSSRSLHKSTVGSQLPRVNGRGAESRGPVSWGRPPARPSGRHSAGVAHSLDPPSPRSSIRSIVPRRVGAGAWGQRAASGGGVGGACSARSRRPRSP